MIMSELSVVIPVYNMERYIRNCLDSVVNQTFKDIEIIVVNDKSNDHTKEIVSEFYIKYPHIIIIDNLENEGSGRSRNKGIMASDSNYIGFIDGDDWVDLNYYSTLMSAARSTDSDIIMASITDEFNNHISAVARYAYSEEFTIDWRTGLRLLTKSENMGTYITPIMNNKIYKREFLVKNGIVCSDNKSWQDDFFSFFAILYADKITFTPGTTYHYKQCPFSVTHAATDSKSKIDNCLDVLCKIRTRLQASGLYSIYKHEYQSFVERSISSLLVMIHNDTKKQDSDILPYLFSELTQMFNVGDIIRYLDNERIYHFFDL